jgi:uncharacterized protein YcbX
MPEGDDMPTVAGIWIYPVKSLEPVSVEQSRVLESGALEGDRAFALLDAAGKYVNGKRHSRIHLLRSKFDAMLRTIQLQASSTSKVATFQLDTQQEELNDWLSEFFGFPVHIEENRSAGFPDDTDSPGPTIISTATLQEVASWFPGVSVDSMRKRIRANIEIGGVEPFWEDRLFGLAGEVVRFRIGDVLFEGANPCQRCVVPSRDPVTGQAIAEFAKVFAARRERTLPRWAERSRFNHFYRLAINTRVPGGQGGTVIRVGDEVELVS